jgi:hypothetical protein
LNNDNDPCLDVIAAGVDALKELSTLFFCFLSVTDSFFQIVRRRLFF